MIISNDTNTFGGYLLGSGKLYATPAASFSYSTEVDDMDEIGYISEEAVFKRTKTVTDVETANYGLIDTVDSKYVTTFDTGVISYNAQNVKKYLSGSDVVVGTGTETMYFSDDDKAPAVALVFVGEDTDASTTFELVMPKCKFVGDYELNFNVEKPVELNYSYKCISTTMPNGKRGAAYIRKTTTTPVSED